MKAEELRLDELVRFGEGLVDLHGRRLLIQDITSFAQFCRDLIEMVGREDARRIMTRWGYFWGQVDAATMQRLFQWDNLTEWLKAALRLHRLMGAGTPTVVSYRVGSGNGPLFHGGLLPRLPRSGQLPGRIRDIGQAPLLDSYGIFQRLRYLLPWKERVLRRTRVPGEGR